MNFHQRTLNMLYAGLAIAALGVTTSCKKKQDSTPRPTGAAVALINGSYNAPPLLASVDGKKMITIGISTGGHSGKEGLPYVVTAAIADKELKITDDKEKLLFTGKTKLEQQKFYSIVTYGEVKDSKLQQFQLNDNLLNITGERSGIRILHLAPDVPAVQVVLVKGRSNEPAGNPIKYVGTTPDTKTLEPFFAANAGVYTLQLKTAEATPKTLLEVNNFTLLKGKNYTIYFKGTLNGTGVAKLSTGVVRHN